MTRRAVPAMQHWYQRMFGRPSRSSEPIARHGETFTGLRSFEQIVIENSTFTDCIFEQCGTVSKDPERRSVLRNVTLESCTERNCTVIGASLDSVTVNGLRVADALILRGCVFRHVTLAGRIGRILMNPEISPPTSPDPALERRFAEDVAAHYREVDWALDISGAEFSDVSIRCIPASLIKRDPHSQLFITRNKAMEGRWRSLDLERTHWPIAFEMFLKRGDADTIFVAPKRAKNYRDLQLGLDLIREAGIGS